MSIPVQHPGSDASVLHSLRLVCAATTAFWDAYLKGGTAAKTWLDNGGFAAELSPSRTIEEKHFQR